MEDISVGVYADFEAYEKAKRTEWAEAVRTAVDEREQWVERSWAIAEVPREWW